MKINSHIHTTGSDGCLSPREVVEEALNVGLKHICFTDHFLLPKEVRDWATDRHHEDYLNELKKLKEEFSNKIDISIGVEVDWLEGYEEWYREEIMKRDYDFVLGSIHFMKHKKGQGGFDPIDYNSDTTKTIAEEYGGIRNLIEEYFNQQKKMLDLGIIDCIGHMDSIKKTLEKNYSEEKWYMEAVLSVLRKVKEKEKCIELNASGWKYDFGEQYPSLWILREANKLKIPLTIGNDFHDKEWNGKKINIDYKLKDALKIAKEADYEKISFYKNRKRTDFKIEDEEC